jgi:hypothetical protein
VPSGESVALTFVPAVVVPVIVVLASEPVMPTADVVDPTKNPLNTPPVSVAPNQPKSVFVANVPQYGFGTLALVTVCTVKRPVPRGPAIVPLMLPLFKKPDSWYPPPPASPNAPLEGKYGPDIVTLVPSKNTSVPCDESDVTLAVSVPPSPRSANAPEKFARIVGVVEVVFVGAVAGSLLPHAATSANTDSDTTRRRDVLSSSAAFRFRACT